MDIKIEKQKIFLDTYETNIYDNIKNNPEFLKCSQMRFNQREFLNGAIRKFRPKKILEIRVYSGGSSTIILNAIKDIEGAHLYSVDLDNDEDKIGSCVKKFFPNLMNKWTLYTGNVISEFIEQIGKDIDMVFIDSSHFQPGEILDFIIVLPFLKEGAIVGFHDIANQIIKGSSRKNWAPYIIFYLIRGEKFLPSWNKILTQNIGVIKLENNQLKFVYDYFRALGGQWQYFPKKRHIKSFRKIIRKYYDQDCLTMFEETVKFNRKFCKKNPLSIYYKQNID